MKIKWLIFVMSVLTVGAVIICIKYSSESRRQPFEYLSAARELIAAENYEGAIDECAEGLRKYPDNADLYIEKARAYALSGNIEKALGTVDRGYKKTGSAALIEMREQYADSAEPEWEYFGAGDTPMTYPAADGQIPDTGGEQIQSNPAVYTFDEPIEVKIPLVTLPEPPAGSDEAAGQTAEITQ